MKISILTDNNPGTFTQAEHGLSYLIEHDGKKILFDTGQSDLFLRNAGKMNTDLENIDTVILSHGHFDHGNGLEYLSEGTLICHPGCFVKRYREKDRTYIGLKKSKEELSAIFNLNTSRVPVKISEKIIFLGEIPRETDSESKTTPFILDDETPDFVMDDSAVALIIPEGLFVVTGCGHSGIVNTLKHAMKITGIGKISGIMGGFHLKEIDNQLKETIKFLRENKVKHVIPSHCTEFPALALFYELPGFRQVKTGDILFF